MAARTLSANELAVEEECRSYPQNNVEPVDEDHSARRIKPKIPFALGRGIVLDIRARAPFYKSDWTDAWNYRVLPASSLIFFANVLPGIAFSLHLIETTHQYGVTEVLLSSFLAAFVFSVFGAQPLTIAGVTGPITVFNKTIYDITQRQSNPPNYLHFVGWVYFWAAIFHWITAALNWCNFLKYVTLFSCDTFGFYVSWVYLQYGIQIITRQLDNPMNTAGGFVSIIAALLMLVTSFLFKSLSKKPYFHRHVRRFFSDYGMPISLVASSAVAYWGKFKAAKPTTLPVSAAFKPVGGRDWLVKFWLLEGKWVAIALPFGILLWILFFFDHNVSSLMAQGSEFPLRKPPGFHYDFLLLGITTFVAGLLGLPAPNGLIPQAPIHTTSLRVMARPLELPCYEKEKTDVLSSVKAVDYESQRDSSATPPRRVTTADGLYPFHSTASYMERPVAVVEQRVSNLTQGALCLVLLANPFLHVLGLIPRGALAGLFWFMGIEALQANGITQRLQYILRDKSFTPAQEPLRKVRKSRLFLFLAAQLVGFGTTFAVTQTIAAIGFPIVIMLLLPFRTLVIPRLPFNQEELAILDGPAASLFTMESVGGVLEK